MIQKCKCTITTSEIIHSKVHLRNKQLLIDITVYIQLLKQLFNKYSTNH